MLESAPKYQFPWRAGNRFELLIDGSRFFPRMLEAVEQATRFIWIAIYLFESSRGAMPKVYRLCDGEGKQRGEKRSGSEFKLVAGKRDKKRSKSVSTR